MKKPVKKEEPKVKSEDVVICEGCGRKIPKERLKAVPNTELCVHCAAKSEEDGINTDQIPLVDYDPMELLDAISSDD